MALFTPAAEERESARRSNLYNPCPIFLFLAFTPPISWAAGGGGGGIIPCPMRAAVRAAFTAPPHREGHKLRACQEPLSQGQTTILMSISISQLFKVYLQRRSCSSSSLVLSNLGLKSQTGWVLEFSTPLITLLTIDNNKLFV